MKVKSQNRKQKFLSQLRKHLRSPEVAKTLGRKKRRTKTKPKVQSTQSVTSVLPTSHQQSLQCRVIRRAGEKLKESLKRFWDTDIIQEKRESLINYAIERNKVVTASKIVSIKSLNQPSTSKKQSSEEGEKDTDSPSKESSSASDSSPSSCTSHRKDFYIHCSSPESTLSSTPEENAKSVPRSEQNAPSIHTSPCFSKSLSYEKPSVCDAEQSTLAVIKSAEKVTETNDIVEPPSEVPTRSHEHNTSQSKFDFKISSSAQGNADKILDDICKHILTYSSQYQEILSQESSGDTDSQVKKNEKRVEPPFERLHRDDKLLTSQVHPLNEGFQRLPKTESIADEFYPSTSKYKQYYGLPPSSLHVQLTPKKRHNCFDQSASASMVKSSAIFNHSERSKREISSDKTLQFRQYLLENDNSNDNCKAPARKDKPLRTHLPVYISTSDSDSDNEVLLRMKQATKKQDISLGLLPSCRFQPPVPINLFNDDAAPSLSDSDSSPCMECRKPFFIDSPFCVLYFDFR